MNDLLKACELAVKYFNHYIIGNDIWGIGSVSELPDKWIISQANVKNPKEAYFGPQPVAVYKKSFKIEDYIVIEHLDELKNAVQVKVPKEYKLKNEEDEDIPYFASNEDWYYYDEKLDKCFLTDKAPQKAIDSYNEWYNDGDDE